MAIGDVLVIVLGAVAALSWVSAFLHWIWMLGHRRPEISLGTLLVSGYKSYDSSNFLPSGKKIHRRFLLSIGGFFLCVVSSVILSTVLRRRKREIDMQQDKSDAGLP